MNNMTWFEMFSIIIVMIMILEVAYAAYIDRGKGRFVGAAI
jgi:hypothetical protein